MGQHDERSGTGRQEFAPAADEDIVAARLAAVLHAAVSPDAGAIAAAACSVWRKTGERRIDRDALQGLAGLGPDPQAADRRMRIAETAITIILGDRILDWEASTHDVIPQTRTGRGLRAERAEGTRMTIGVLSDAFIRLIENPQTQPIQTLSCAPGVDTATRAWVAAIAHATGAGTPLHLALRCRRPGNREIDDFAGLLRHAGLTVFQVAAKHDEIQALIPAELHAPAGTVVVVQDAVLFDATDGADDYEAPRDQGSIAATQFAVRSTHWLFNLRCIHVWRMPAEGEPDPSLDGFLGGCVGPIAYDRDWSLKLVQEILEGVGPSGAAALTARVEDPRDIGAMAATVRHFAAATKGGVPDVDAACATIAGSFAAKTVPRTPLAEPDGFDPRLLACDPDALALLERAGAAAKNGARLLAWGPPGGGKSTYAQVLAIRMANTASPRREVIVITPAAILARPLGATERIMEGIWARAANAAGGAVLLVDELDAMCGVRDPDGASSGNAYLVRVLTDQWLRCFDLHPNVPIVATVNDPRAVDTAVLRRFQLVLEFGDELSPEAERLAWTLILKRNPPAGWEPCGAAVADIASAGIQCRLIGTSDHRALASAIVKARAVRRGERPKSTARPRLAINGPIH